MKVIVGLGNPGPQYARNRHNIGFQVVDLLAQRHSISLSRAKFNALFGVGTITRSRALESKRLQRENATSQKVLMMRPLTFMNLSGNAVAPMAHFYRVEPEDIFVIYDELDLPSGNLRLRPFGGSGGHNGMKSLIRLLGTRSVSAGPRRYRSTKHANEFGRLRFAELQRRRGNHLRISTTAHCRRRRELAA